MYLSVSVCVCMYVYVSVCILSVSVCILSVSVCILSVSVCMLSVFCLYLSVSVCILSVFSLYLSVFCLYLSVFCLYLSVSVCICLYLSVSVCILALVIQHSERILSALYNIFICGLSGSTKFLSLSYNGQDIPKTYERFIYPGLGCITNSFFIIRQKYRHSENHIFIYFYKIINTNLTFR